LNKPESEILREIQIYINNQGYVCWRNHVFNGRVKGGYLRTGIVGLSDLTVMLKGKHLYLEVKTATGKQRDAQEAFEATCKANGHLYYIVRSVGDVIELLRRIT
jgi:hypothetical protein